MIKDAKHPYDLELVFRVPRNNSVIQCHSPEIKSHETPLPDIGTRGGRVGEVGKVGRCYNHRCYAVSKRMNFNITVIYDF